MIEAFDSDVLIFSAKGDWRGRTISQVIEDSTSAIGSVVLLPEVLGKPLREGPTSELDRLTDLLTLLRLEPTSLEVAETATAASVAYRLQAADAIHLATAIVHGASRFHTGNRKDFAKPIEELEVVIW